MQLIWHRFWLLFFIYKDDKYIIGADDQSVGWDLVSKNVYFNGCAVKTLPEDPTQMDIPSKVIMGLDMSTGILSFSSKGQDYGRAMSGIKVMIKLSVECMQ